MPYAWTIKEAVTSCDFELVPATLNLILFEDRSKDMSTFCTCMEESPPQFEKPSVLIISAARDVPSSVNDARARSEVFILVPDTSPCFSSRVCSPVWRFDFDST